LIVKLSTNSTGVNSWEQLRCQGHAYDDADELNYMLHTPCLNKKTSKTIFVITTPNFHQI